VIADNGGNGITIGSSVRFRTATITGHADGFGIFGAATCWSRTTRLGNLAGIVVGDFGTVTFNDVQRQYLHWPVRPASTSSQAT
jgi:hypothetical protein